MVWFSVHLSLLRPVEHEYILRHKKIVFFAFMVRLGFTYVFLCSQLFELLLGTVKWIIQK